MKTYVFEVLRVVEVNADNSHEAEVLLRESFEGQKPKNYDLVKIKEIKIPDEWCLPLKNTKEWTKWTLAKLDIGQITALLESNGVADEVIDQCKTKKALIDLYLEEMQPTDEQIKRRMGIL